jgi:hypothetical protein
MQSTSPLLKIVQLSEKAKYRWMVFCRVITGFFGGYVLTSYLTIVLAQIIPMPRAEAVVLASLLSYLWFCLIIIWVFSVRSTLKACLGVIVTTGFLMLVNAMLQTGWMS